MARCSPLAGSPWAGSWCARPSARCRVSSSPCPRETSPPWPPRACCSSPPPSGPAYPPRSARCASARSKACGRSERLAEDGQRFAQARQHGLDVLFGHRAHAQAEPAVFFREAEGLEGHAGQARAVEHVLAHVLVRPELVAGGSAAAERVDAGAQAPMCPSRADMREMTSTGPTAHPTRTPVAAKALLIPSTNTV